MNKKEYIKPEFIDYEVDLTSNLVLMSGGHGGGHGGEDDDDDNNDAATLSPGFDYNPFH